MTFLSLILKLWRNVNKRWRIMWGCDDELLNLQDMPYDLLLEILTRLPVKSLFRFKSVCKTWCYLIQDPIFIQRHSKQSKKAACLYLSVGKGYFRHIVAVNQQGATASICRMRSPCCPLQYCNGLICYSTFGTVSPRRTNLHVFNPTTGESTTLPTNSGYCIKFGLGYDESINKYKVVDVDSSPCLIFTLGEDSSWRPICSKPAVSVLPAESIFVNGALHWNSDGVVISFDLKNEKFGAITHPKKFTSSSWKYLLDCEGFLCMFCVDNNNYQLVFSLWMLKDYDTWVEWSFVLPDLPTKIDMPEVVVLNGEILTVSSYYCARTYKRLHRLRYYLHSYNLQSRVSKKIEILDLPSHLNYVAAAYHEESLVSLRNV
ncbi:hypothetical protein IFM89_036713 [Coptis chinensis]|uniref:F-box domain-containing protein n=1 Tax=Coptis chinensis TaxID=261450 RepID=A0A835II54_9MAGN|nr:hypothetical protein IFM89_036713 [Coptis chinensis]